MGKVRAGGRTALVVVAAIGMMLAAWLLDSRAAPSVPNPFVKVRTLSGGIERTAYVPIGGVPVPLDVDANLGPDIDVSVGLLSLSDLPNSPIVPSITVQRNALAQTLGTPVPPLQIDTQVKVVDLLSFLKIPLLPLSFDTVAEIHYGFRTPPGSVVPPRVTAKLTGPILQGFVDPLEARIETPGYGGPLQFDVRATTKKLDADLHLRFDALPERLHFTEDPAADGMTFDYDHTGSNPDVNLDATATIKDLEANTAKEISAEVDRLPAKLHLEQHSVADLTTVDYDYSSPVGAPDIAATYRSRDASDAVTLDARLRLGALPPSIHAELEHPESGIRRVDIAAAEGTEIGEVGVLARNYAVGEEDPLPAMTPRTGPPQQLTAVTRITGDGSVRWRASGRVEHVRGVAFERVGAKHDGIDLRTDLGDGKAPLRAAFDLDGRGPGAEDGAKRVRVDATVDPLPATIHTRYEAAAGNGPMTLTYEPSATTDVRAKALIVKGGHDECGDPLVTCAEARIDRLPAPLLTATLPTAGGTDYTVHHTGGADPDVHAVVDATPEDPTKRTYAEIHALGVPHDIAARVVTGTDGLRAAEFHACEYDFGFGGCKFGTEDPLDSVRFLVRDRPDRGPLPTQPDAAEQHVSLVGRDGRTEAVGRVDEIRELRVARRGGVDGTIGAKVRAGGGRPLEVVADLADADAHTATRARIGIAKLPARFSGCLQRGGEHAPPLPSADDLLSTCETGLAVAPALDEPLATPLAVHYEASSDTRVRAEVESEERVNGVDENVAVSSTVDAVPPLLDVAVVPVKDGDPEHKGRDLQVAYDASAPIGALDVALAKTRGDAVCDDPRPGREALCVRSHFSDVPRKLRVGVVDDDHGAQQIRLVAEHGSDPAMDIAGLRVSKVGDGERLGVTGTIHDLPERLKADITTVGEGDDAETGRVRFDACPTAGWNDAANPDAAGCHGIPYASVTVRKAPDDAKVPDAAASSIDDIAEGPPVDRFALTSRGDAMLARATLHDIRAAEYSKLADDGHTKTDVLRADLHVGTGDEQALDVAVDRRDGPERQVVDARITDLPRGLGLCFRGPIETAPDKVGFCGRQAADATAVQAFLGTPGSARPDIELERLLIRGEDGKGIVGKATITDLAERLDVVAALGEAADISVEGHHAADPDGADPVAAAGRMTFDVRTFEGEVGTSFPARPAPGFAEPDADQARITDPDGTDHAGTNVLKVQKSGDRLRLTGSVPNLRRVQLSPRPCPETLADQSGRFPYVPGTPPPGAPSYTCLRAAAAVGRPLGLAVRLRDGAELTAIDEGFVSEMPEQLAATIGQAAPGQDGAPVCTDGTLPCRPPVLALVRSGDQVPLLEARLARGPETLVNQTASGAPDDAMSAVTKFGAAPSGWAHDGARVRLSKSPDGTALRAGLRLRLPRFVDLDPPTTASCEGECAEGWTDVALRLVGADSAPLAADPDLSLGRVAVWVEDPSSLGEVVLAGAPPAGDDGVSPYDPEHRPAVAGAWADGFVLSGYTDIRLFLRTDDKSGGQIGNAEDPAWKRMFVQLDTRTTLPLSLQARLTAPGAGVANRDGEAVAAQAFTLRRAGGAAPGQTTFPDPTFRLRAAIDADLPNGGGATSKPCHSPYVPYEWPSVGKRRTGFKGCFFGPSMRKGWLDVQIDAAPPASGGAPARRIEALVDGTRGSQRVNVYGFADPDGPTPARFTVHGGIAFPQFDFAAELSILGAGRLWRAWADVVGRFQASGVTAAKLSQHLASFRVGAEGGGTMRLDPDIRARFRRLGFIGGASDADGRVVEDTSYAEKQMTIGWRYCKRVYVGSFDDMASSDPNGLEGKVNLTNSPIDILAEVAYDVVFCPAKKKDWAQYEAPTFDDNSAQTRPTFEPSGHPVPNAPSSNAEKPPAPGVDQDGPLPDLEIPAGQSRVACGDLHVRKLILHENATLRAGRAGEEVDEELAPGLSQDTLCFGNLRIEAESVSVADGAVITATGASGGGPGDAPDGGGGGAGNVHGGGASGLDGGAGGSSYGLADGGLLDTLGSGGGDGTGAAGGRGGGSISLSADSDIVLAGTVAAGGEAGKALGGAASCARVAGGGGSGGVVALTAKRVTITGSGGLSVRGGDGGAGGGSGNGGGGGSGGRILVDAPIRDGVGGDALSTGGGAGGGSEDCDGGAKGGGGDADVSPLTRIASVERVKDTDPWEIGDGADHDGEAELTLRVRAVQKGGGPLQIVVCHRHVPAGPGVGLGDPGLAPDPEQVLGDFCRQVPFDAPNDGADGYVGTINYDSKLSEGYHGFYAVAARPPNDQVQCQFGGFLCAYQETPPQGSLRLTVDLTPPVVDSAKALDGVACDDGPLCVSRLSPYATVDVAGHDALTDVAAIHCVRFGEVVLEDCGGGHARVPLPDDGLAGLVSARIVDSAGNVASTGISGYLVDGVAPTASIQALPTSVETNGWTTSAPNIHTKGTDPAPASGVAPTGMRLLVDGEARDLDCGDDSICTGAETAPAVPDEGDHELRVQPVDRVGNVGPETEAVHMRADGTPPDVALALGPQTPDGAAGWYRTRPRIGFAVDDHGGSGVDPETEPSEVRYRVDDGAWKTWTVEGDHRVPDGVHELCWQATDVAGNQAAPVCTKKPVKVDATAPVASLAVAPNFPDGLQLWHVTAPDITTTGKDAGSGVDVAEVQVDDGTWQPAGKVVLPQGRHDVRVRTVDVAGNRDVTERRLSVDTLAPAAAQLSWVPGPNALGWLRRPVITGAAGIDPQPGSGVTGATIRRDGEAPLDADDGELTTGDGTHELAVRARDAAGNTGPEAKRIVQVDTKAPSAAPAGPAPGPILLPGQTSTLRFDAQGTGTPHVKVRVVVFSVLGNVAVRRLVAPGPHPEGYRDAGPGAVTWDGTNDKGQGVLPGVYLYRVQVTDEAGNTGYSGESQKILVGLTPNPAPLQGTGTLLGGVLAGLGLF